MGHLVVALGAAGLHEGRDAVLHGELGRVGEGEEGVGADRGALEVASRLLDGDARRVDAAHLPRPDAQRGQVPGDDDGVGLDVLGHALGEEEVAPFCFGGVALGHDLHLVALLDVGVPVLRQHASEDALVVHLARVELAALLVDEDADVALLAQDPQRRFVVGGREEHLDEELAHHRGRLGVDRPVDGDHGAEGANGIALVGSFVGAGQLVAEGAAAGVVVLDDHAAGEGELHDERARRVQIVEVVERELPAVQLGDT